MKNKPLCLPNNRQIASIPDGEKIVDEILVRYVHESSVKEMVCAALNKGFNKIKLSYAADNVDVDARIFLPNEINQELISRYIDFVNSLISQRNMPVHSSVLGSFNDAARDGWSVDRLGLTKNPDDHLYYALRNSRGIISAPY